MNTSPEIKNIALALVNFHKEVGKIKKDANNPFFKSKYASLSQILETIDEPLVNNGLTLVQFPDGVHGLTTRLIHTSGEFMEATYTMKPVKDAPQDLGSAITYQRRYAIGAILSLNIDEDDDGNSASNRNGNGATARSNGRGNGLVQNETERKPNPISEELFAEMEGKVKGARDLPELEKVWEAYPDYQNHTSFKAIVKNHKKFLADIAKKMEAATV